MLVHEVIDLRAIGATLATRVDGTNGRPGQQQALTKHMRIEHSTPEEVGRVAQEAGVKLLLLTRLVTGTRSDGDQGYIESAKQSHSGPVIVGRDLIEF